MPSSSISYLWSDANAPKGFRTGVSLHSHTNQSQETLDFLANFGNQFPVIRPVLARMEHVRRAVVVTGSDGLDEVTLDGPTHVLVVDEGLDGTGRPRRLVGPSGHRRESVRGEPGSVGLCSDTNSKLAT